jgi:hypothetical protein
MKLVETGKAKGYIIEKAINEMIRVGDCVLKRSNEPAI